MAHIPVGEGGISWYTVLQDERSTDRDGDYLTRVRLLPQEISPYEKQLRVVVDGVEYAYDDGNDPSTLTNLWSYTTQSNPAQGVMCSGIRIEVGTGVWQSNQFGVRDGNGEWYTDLVFGTNVFMTGNGNEGRLFDKDGTTQYDDSGSPTTLNITFDRPRAVSAFGWARGTGSAVINTMQVEVNTGGLDMIQADRVFVLAGSQTGLLTGDYTVPTNYDPDVDLLFIEVAASLATEWDMAKNPVIDVVPVLTVDQRITIWRETRQDRPHNPPRSGARVDGENLHWYFMQRLFIMEDVCEYRDLSNFLDFGLYDTVDLFDFTVGNQIQNHLNHSTEDEFSFGAIALLTGIPGATNLGDQIIVERGDQTDGTSTVWTLESDTLYTVNSTTLLVTLDSTTGDDIRIRRQTKNDDLWFDMRSRPPAWNILALGVNMTQIKYLVEEACFIPRFFDGSLLGNTIFPREWNWLIYKGTALFHIFGGPFWTGDGAITVWDNDLPLTDPPDYTTLWPTIRFTGPITQPRIGGSGRYWGDTAGFGGLGEAMEAAAQEEPPEDQSPIDPLDPIFNAGLNIGISINFVDGATLVAGPVQGFPNGIAAATAGTNTGSFGSDNMYIAIALTIRQAFTGQTTVNKTVVAYCAGVCNGATVFGLKAVAKASDNNGDGTFESTVEVSGALGCSEGNSNIGNITAVWDDWLAFRGVYGSRELITANERAMLQIIAAQVHRTLAITNAESSVIGMNNISASGIAGGGVGGTVPSDINDIMGP